MTEEELLAARFEEQRPRLRAVAMRMLGSASDADDAVQEAWLRLSRTGAAAVNDLAAWLTTVVARVSLNILRARGTRREQPLPEDSAEPHGAAPEDQVVFDDSVGVALLVVLDTLGPAERLAFVLHDLFGVPFDDIAPIVERSPVATRQLASRARRRVRGATVAGDGDASAKRATPRPRSSRSPPRQASPHGPFTGTFRRRKTWYGRSSSAAPSSPAPHYARHRATATRWTSW